MSVRLYETAVYDSLTDETIIYGQHSREEHYDIAIIEGVPHQLVKSEHFDVHPNFYLKHKGKKHFLNRCDFINQTITSVHNVSLKFPFDEMDLELRSTSAVISTMCKHYAHRLDEWIQYNLNLGFSGIVIFDNDASLPFIDSDGKKVDDSAESKAESTAAICKKYKGKVWGVDFPYSPIPGMHWNSVQLISLSIGTNALRTKCRHIALIDADEFIYYPRHLSVDIEDFLLGRGTITLRSNLLTNKNANDVLTNNVLELATHVGEDKYLKTIIRTSLLTVNELLVSPHEHPTQEIMAKETIMHYHCWMNGRCDFHETMPYVDLKKEV